MLRTVGSQEDSIQQGSSRIMHLNLQCHVLPETLTELEELMQKEEINSSPKMPMVVENIQTQGSQR